MTNEKILNSVINHIENNMTQKLLDKHNDFIGYIQIYCKDKFDLDIPILRAYALCGGYDAYLDCNSPKVKFDQYYIL